MFALLGVLTPLIYSLFFANISLSWVYIGPMTLVTCWLSLVYVSKSKKTIIYVEKASVKERLSLGFKKSSLENLLKFRVMLNLGFFRFFWPFMVFP